VDVIFNSPDYQRRTIEIATDAGKIRMRSASVFYVGQEWLAIFR
jgi:hypothetical protein